MIIGNNNQNNSNNILSNDNKFNTKLNTIQDANVPSTLIPDSKSIRYSNPTSNSDMRTKTLAILQERLENGLISLDEFNKQCNKLSKMK